MSLLVVQVVSLLVSGFILAMLILVMRKNIQMHDAVSEMLDLQQRRIDTLNERIALLESRR